MYVELQLLWEGLLWLPWSWRSTQTSHARFRPQTGHWHDGTKCSEMMIYLARWNKKTNKQRRTAPFISIHLWPGHVTNGYCNIQWIWKIVFSKTTSRISKPLSVFDKLGLGSKYRGGGDSVSAHRVEKNAASGDAQIKSQRRSPSSTKRGKRGDCKLAWISAICKSRKFLFLTRGDVWNIRLTVNSIETTTNVSIVN